MYRLLTKKMGDVMPSIINPNEGALLCSENMYKSTQRTIHPWLSSPCIFFQHLPFFFSISSSPLRSIFSILFRSIEGRRSLLLHPYNQSLKLYGQVPEEALKWVLMNEQGSKRGLGVLFYFIFEEKYYWVLAIFGKISRKNEIVAAFYIFSQSFIINHAFS